MNQDPTSQPNSIPTLLRDLRDETTTLFRQEVTLAKTELKDNASRMGSNIAKLAVGGFVAYAGVIVLLIGLGHLLGVLLVRVGLDEGIAAWLAPTSVGLIVALIGWMMLARAKNAMANTDLKPHQTIESLRNSKEWAQSKLHQSS